MDIKLNKLQLERAVQEVEQACKKNTVDRLTYSNLKQVLTKYNSCGNKWSKKAKEKAKEKAKRLEEEAKKSEKKGKGKGKTAVETKGADSDDEVSDPPTVMDEMKAELCYKKTVSYLSTVVYVALEVYTKRISEATQPSATHLKELGGCISDFNSHVGNVPDFNKETETVQSLHELTSVTFEKPLESIVRDAETALGWCPPSF